MPKDDLTKEEIIKLLTFFTTEISKVDNKLDELIDSVTPDDLPDEIALGNLSGADIPFPIETLVKMGEYLGKMPFFLGIT